MDSAEARLLSRRLPIERPLSLELINREQSRLVRDAVARLSPRQPAVEQDALRHIAAEPATAIGSGD